MPGAGKDGEDVRVARAVWSSERQGGSMEKTKKPTRDYASLAANPWTIWDTLYARRSHRKYIPTIMDEGLLASLEEFMRLALEVRGAARESILLVSEPERVEEIKRRAHKGAAQKINLWLNRSPLLGFLVLALPVQDVREERPSQLPRSVMAAEDCVLWLTERELGTCWLGGINHSEVKDILRLEEDLVVPAAISFGKPKPRVRARDYDHLVYHTLSRHRKPLSAIAYRESMEAPFEAGGAVTARVEVSEVQDTAGLLKSLREREVSGEGIPLELALEACLEAARVAPSASNAQRWRFVAVTDAGKVRDLAEVCGSRAAWRAAVVGLGRQGAWEYTFFEKHFWMIDLPIAFSHLTLMAASMCLAVDLILEGFDAEAVGRLVAMTPGYHVAGVMGIR